MGCGSSSQQEGASSPRTLEDEKNAILEEDRKAGKISFLGSIVRAVNEHGDNAKVLLDAATQLQAHNRNLKSFVANLDAIAAHEAMKGGMTGIGCNDKKLIACLCTRTKSQLARTAQQYRKLYDRDLRSDAKGEAGGHYGRLVYHALGSRAQYVSEMIDVACGGFGCNETVLVELFASCTYSELRAGKKARRARSRARDPALRPRPRLSAPRAPLDARPPTPPPPPLAPPPTHTLPSPTPAPPRRRGRGAPTSRSSTASTRSSAPASTTRCASCCCACSRATRRRSR